MGQRLTGRDPIHDSKTKALIDDGTNIPLVLMSNFPEWCADIFLGNLKSQHSKKVWKFWIV